ncbi:MAG: hypothetical protein IPP48_08920 [Chitinophagaceae bacterium]|nr:hypothetical protein [Chitinophagaceae bacterium]
MLNGNLLAQNIDKIINDPSNNYFTIKQKAEAFFADRGTVGTGYKEFKRWEFLTKNNIAADGTLPDFVKRNQEALDNFRLQNEQTNLVTAGVPNWVALGQPNPTIQAGDAQNGTGSVRSIDFLGSDMWVGTPGGGIWFGDFLGGSVYAWSAKTDGIPNLAVQDMEIAPANTNIIYALTGAVGSASGYRSTGVLKSTDAGVTWNTTGLNFPESGGVKGYKLLANATNASVVWACTDNGLYRTADGGTTWALVTYHTTIGGAETNFSTNAYDIVYQPGSTTVMYATSNGPYFYKSTDAGLTFLRVDRATAGLPTTGGNRLQIGVTAANSAYIYLLYGDGTAYQGLYLSTNSGSTFTLKSTTPNILGGQAWRNISIAVSPTNAADLYVGGLDVYKSTTSGVSWTQVSDWTSSSTSNFCHADIFDLYCDATYLYCASDGGIYRMTRSTDSWTNLHSNMQISQAYRLGVDPSASAGFATMGLQDNGTYRNTGAQFLSIGGGDGMETIIKPSNTNVIYLSSQSGSFYRSDDGGTTNVFIRSGAGNWTTPAVLRPGFDTHIYIGYTNIDYNTTSGTGAWSGIATGFGSAIESLEFAPNNNTILYATDGSAVKRFNLSGAVWSATTITGSLPAITNITELAVDPNNSSHVVLSVGGYTATQKVYETFNANAASPTWTSIVRNLPNVPVNCIVMNNDAANSIYIGTDIGVFVTDDNRINWIMYNNNLPTTRIYDLEINSVAATPKIFAATFGRGVFKADTYTGCISSATLNGSISGLHYTEVSSDINSTQSIWGGVGSSVGYSAGSMVILNPGFEAKQDVKFEAYIQGCTGIPHQLRVQKINKTINEENKNILAEGDVKTNTINNAKSALQKSDNLMLSAEGDVKNSLPVKQREKPTKQNTLKPEGDE